MYGDDPLAYFITWTVYGTFLQGKTGWKRRHRGEQLPQPRLAEWRRARLKHDVILLSPEHRATVNEECRRRCEHRGWRLWEVNARSNHVHAVVSAPDVLGKIVRDQLKANCTRGLRECWAAFAERPVWAVGGDVGYVDSENDLDDACLYVREMQDRKKKPDASACRLAW